MATYQYSTISMFIATISFLFICITSTTEASLTLQAAIPSYCHPLRQAIAANVTVDQITDLAKTLRIPVPSACRDNDLRCHQTALLQNCRHPRSRPRHQRITKPVTNTKTSAVNANKRKFMSQIKRTGVLPQAYSGNWQCAHSTGDGKGCFFTTAKYLGKVVGKCAQCALEFVGSDSNGDGRNDITITPPIYDKPVQIAGADARKCPSCVQTAADAPKCGGKFLGIGSKRKGRSCMLVDGNGCWPKSSDRIILQCRKGQECRFKVTGAKAKVWCCSKKKSGFKSIFHNPFRCSSKAERKSKDRNGASVLWE